MKMGKKLMPLLSAGFLVFGMYSGTTAFADSDDRYERRERGERHERGERAERAERGERGGAGQRQAELVESNKLYKQECSSCHFLYLPGLLPSNSWDKLVKESDKHFGENLGLDDATKAELAKFLTANSAEKTNTEWGRKISRSAAPGTVRITDVPWIAKEHRKIKDEVYKRASIGSKSNCAACHRNAAKGDFEEEGVIVPQK